MSAPEFNSTSPSLSDAINKLMANPEIISTVASALGNMNIQGAGAPPSDSKVSENKQNDDSIKADVNTEQAPGSPDLGEIVKGLAPVMSRLRGRSAQSRDNRDSDRREALLCALKPYVNDGRKEAIDYIIRISQISDILRNIQH